MTDTWLPDPKVTPAMPPVKAPRRTAQTLLLPENYLEVGLTPDEREIVVNVPAAPGAGAHHLVFSPAQARHLAKLLLRKADECEPERTP